MARTQLGGSQIRTILEQSLIDPALVGFSPTHNIIPEILLSDTHLTILLRGVFKVYVRGTEFSFIDDLISIDRKTLSNGFHFIFYIIEDEKCVLRCSPVAWIISAEKAPVAYFYWNATNYDPLLCIGYELHTTSMSWVEHSRIHFLVGTKYIDGLDVTQVGDHSISLTDGTIQDEDINISIKHSENPLHMFEQELQPKARLSLFYRYGTPGFWKSLPETETLIFSEESGDLLFNSNTEDSDWVLLAADAGKFVSCFIFATNFIDNPIVAVTGQAQHDTLNAAIEDDLTAGSKVGIFSKEFKLLYKVIFQSTPSLTDSKAKIVNITDYRRILDGTNTA